VAAKDTDSGMASDERYVYGPRPLGALVPRLARPAFRRRSPATAQILADWTSIVGPAIAAVTTPRRATSGTLTIACAGPIAMELQYLATELIARINTHLGSQVVRNLRFVQTTVAPVPMPPAAEPADPLELAAAEAAVASLPEGELRNALARLGRAVLADGKRSIPTPPKR